MKISRHKYQPKKQSAKKKYIGGADVDYIAKYLLTVADKSLEKDGDYLVKLLITNNIQNLIGLTDDDEIVHNYNNFFNSVKDNLVKHVFTTKKDIDEYVKTVSVDYDTSIKLLWLVLTLYIIANIENTYDDGDDDDDGDDGDDNDDGDEDIIDINLVSYNTIAKNIKKNRLAKVVKRGGSPGQRRRVFTPKTSCYEGYDTLIRQIGTDDVVILTEALKHVDKIIKSVGISDNTFRLFTDLSKVLKSRLAQITSSTFIRFRKSVGKVTTSVVNKTTALTSISGAGATWALRTSFLIAYPASCTAAVCLSAPLVVALVGAVGSSIYNYNTTSEDEENTKKKNDMEYTKATRDIKSKLRDLCQHEITIKDEILEWFLPIYSDIRAFHSSISEKIRQKNQESGLTPEIIENMTEYSKQLDSILPKVYKIKEKIDENISGDVVINEAIIPSLRKQLDDLNKEQRKISDLFNITFNPLPPFTPPTTSAPPLPTISAPHRPDILAKGVNGKLWWKHLMLFEPAPADPYLPTRQESDDLFTLFKGDITLAMSFMDNMHRLLSEFNGISRKYAFRVLLLYKGDYDKAVLLLQTERTVESLFNAANIQVFNTSAIGEETISQALVASNGDVELAVKVLIIYVLMSFYKISKEDAEAAFSISREDLKTAVELIQTNKNMTHLMGVFGIDRDRAFTALIECDGDLSRATDLIKNLIQTEKDSQSFASLYDISTQQAFEALNFYSRNLKTAKEMTELQVKIMLSIFPTINRRGHIRMLFTSKRYTDVNVAIAWLLDTFISQLIDTGIPDDMCARQLLHTHRNNLKNAVVAIPVFMAGLETLMHKGIEEQEARNLMNLNAGNLQLALAEAQARFTEAEERLDASQPQIYVPEEFVDHIHNKLFQDPVRLYCGNKPNGQTVEHVYPLSTVNSLVQDETPRCPECRAPIKFTIGADGVKTPKIPPIVRLPGLSYKIREWLKAQGLYTMREYVPPVINASTHY